MKNPAAAFLGILLILAGFTALLGTLALPLLTAGAFFGIRYAWTLFVVVIGLGFCLAPVIFFKQRGLGGLFIPGVPILVTGGLLFAANLFNHWGLWARWWTLEVLAVGAGFLMAAIWLRVSGLLVPAFIIGFTGAALFFTNLTGLWGWWGVLWTVVPLGLGFALLLMGLFERNRSLVWVGAGFVLFSTLAFGAIGGLMLFGWQLLQATFAVLLMVLGGALLLANFLRPARRAA